MAKKVHPNRLDNSYNVHVNNVPRQIKTAAILLLLCCWCTWLLHPFAREHYTTCRAQTPCHENTLVPPTTHSHGVSSGVTLI